MTDGKVVTCPQCVERRAEIADAGKHAIRASELFRVGQIAEIRGTHQIYYSIYGPIALCAAARIQRE